MEGTLTFLKRRNVMHDLTRACCALGRTLLRKQYSEPLRTEKIEMYKSLLLSRSEEFKKVAQEDLGHISSLAKQATECLTGEATFSLYYSESEVLEGGILPGEIDEEMHPAFQVAVSFRNLDNALYFLKGIGKLEEDFPEKFQGFLPEAKEDLSEYLLKDFPSHRFIPLNNERRDMLSNVNPDDHYLLPWYDEWSEVPAETLDLYVSSMSGEDVESLDNYLDPALLVTLASDYEMLFYLTKRAGVQRYLRKEKESGVDMLLHLQEILIKMQANSK